jgi:hypothetical protein
MRKKEEMFTEKKRCDAMASPVFQNTALPTSAKISRTRDRYNRFQDTATDWSQRNERFSKTGKLLHWLAGTRLSGRL